MNSITADGRLRPGMAIAVEGRDDVDAVSRACDALIIPTHGFGISGRTWELLDKAYREIGLIILTDPDHAGEDIRRRLTRRFPEAVQCYMAREDAVRDDDIGIENARPGAIREAVARAMELHAAALAARDEALQETSERREQDGMAGSPAVYREVTSHDLAELGLSGASGAADLRDAVSRQLGIGYCNAGAMVKRLRSFHIGYEELRETVIKVTR